MKSWQRKFIAWQNLIAAAREYSRKTGTRGSAKFRMDRRTFQSIIDATLASSHDLDKLRNHFLKMDKAVDVLKSLVIAIRLFEDQLPDHFILPDEFDHAEEFLDSLEEES